MTELVVYLGYKKAVLLKSQVNGDWDIKSSVEYDLLEEVISKFPLEGQKEIHYYFVRYLRDL